jgi:hypothetical protein
MKPRENPTQYPQAPDLGEWVRKYGSYWQIDWGLWDEEMGRWETARRLYSCGTIIKGGQQRKKTNTQTNGLKPNGVNHDKLTNDQYR